MMGDHGPKSRSVVNSSPTFGNPPHSPLLHPARGRPQTEFAMDLTGWKQQEAAQDSFPGDLDQSPDLIPPRPSPSLRMTSVKGSDDRPSEPLSR